MIGITPLELILAMIIGIPIGVVLPVRPRYLFIDFVIAFTFFMSTAVIQIVEHIFDGALIGTGILFALFYIGATVGTRFNKGAKEKEAVIKYLQQTGTPVDVHPLDDQTKG